jgi:hypothetical protein
MIQRLWATGDLQVQKTIAKRADLPYEIEKKVVLNDELLSCWCSRERNGSLLKRAIKNANSSNAIGALIEQVALDESDFNILLGKVDKNTILYLLKRENLSREIRDRALKIFAENASFKSGSFGEVLTSSVGQDIEDWLTILINSTWENSGLIAHTTCYLNRDIRFIEAFKNKFETLDQFTAQKINSNGFLERDLDRDITRIWKIFLTCYSLDNNFLAQSYQDKLFIKINPERSTLLSERLKYNYKEDIAKLNCSGFNDGFLGVERDHAEIIEYLTFYGERSTLPVELIAKEALIHREVLKEGTVNSALSNLLGSGSRSLALEFLDCFPTELGLEYFKLKGVNLIGEHENRVELLKYLASIGHSDIRSSTINIKEKDLIFEYIKPLNTFIGESDYTAILLKRIEVLPLSQQEFIFALLPDWEGTFVELERTSFTI